MVIAYVKSLALDLYQKEMVCHSCQIDFACFNFYETNDILQYYWSLFANVSEHLPSPSHPGIIKHWRNDWIYRNKMLRTFAHVTEVSHLVHCSSPNIYIIYIDKLTSDWIQSIDQFWLWKLRNSISLNGSLLEWRHNSQTGVGLLQYCVPRRWDTRRCQHFILPWYLPCADACQALGRLEHRKSWCL